MSSFKGWTSEAVAEREARFQKALSKKMPQIKKDLAEYRARTFQPENGETVGLLKIKKPKISETVIQQQVIKWFAWTYPEIYKTGAFFAVPNGGGRSKAQAGILKAEGVFPGVADVLLLTPRGGFHGACIEMKAAGGKLSTAQIAWGNARILDGYFVDVCFSYEQAVQTIERYLSLK